MCNKKIDSLLPYGDWMESRRREDGIGNRLLGGT